MQNKLEVNFRFCTTIKTINNDADNEMLVVLVLM